MSLVGWKYYKLREHLILRLKYKIRLLSPFGWADTESVGCPAKLDTLFYMIFSAPFDLEVHKNHYFNIHLNVHLNVQLNIYLDILLNVHLKTHVNVPLCILGYFCQAQSNSSSSWTEINLIPI